MFSGLRKVSFFRAFSETFFSSIFGMYILGISHTWIFMFFFFFYEKIPFYMEYISYNIQKFINNHKNITKKFQNCMSILKLLEVSRTGLNSNLVRNTKGK